ncbi:F5/8 type C domain protein [compost metagenome]
MNIALSTEAYKGEVYYTTDGSNPTISSSNYTGPISIDSSVIIKAVTVLNGNVMGVKPAEQAFIMHKAIGRDVVYSNPISTYYLADGPNSLTDGVLGTKTVNKYWHGISGKDLIATIDLGAEREIKSISLGCLQNYSDWIFLPQEVKFEVSVDGKNFKEAKVIANNISVYEKSTLKSFKAELLKQKVRYVRVSAKNGVCPPNHPGVGKPAWIFVDELVVE